MNFQNQVFLSSSATDASILVYKYRPERTGFNMHAENTQPQLTLLALIPWVKESVGVFLCDPPCKDGKVQCTTVPLKTSSDAQCGRCMVVPGLKALISDNF